MLAQLGLGIILVAVLGGVGLVLLGGKLVGNGAAVLGIKVLVAMGHALGVTGALLKLGHGDVTLITCLVDTGVSNAGMARA